MTVNVKGGIERVRSGELLYQDEVGHDACGIGGVAARDGKPSAEVLRKAVITLKCMEHRGGLCGEAGDGAGITTVIPQAFFKDEARRLKLDGARFLKPEDQLAIGVMFVEESDRSQLDQVRALVRETLTGGPVQFLGIRPVPTNDDVLPARARRTKPAAIEQVLLRATGELPVVERWLYLRRLELRERFRTAGLAVYLPSLSAQLVSYKGLFTCPQLAEYYADLSNPAYETGIAIFHRRFSTNTFPNWTLAQPFRMTCHNGEINTIRTTRNAVSAFARGLKPPLPGGDLLTPKQSDSASLDECAVVWHRQVSERNGALVLPSQG
jgi:glutamate synthase domain-containing protein 1